MAEAMLPSEGAGAVSLATLQGSIYTHVLVTVVEWILIQSQ